MGQKSAVKRSSMLEERAARIQTRDDLVAFLQALRENLRSEPAAWENRTLPDYLEALGAWVEDMDGSIRTEARRRRESLPGRRWVKSCSPQLDTSRQRLKP